MTAFVVEKTLALDNVFVIALIFSYFAIPRQYQHRVLFWGILGVIVLRGLTIGLGATLVAEYSWVLFIFAAVLIFTGIKMLVTDDKEMDLSANPVLKFMRKRFRVTETLHGNNFFVNQAEAKTGTIQRYMTPLFLALILIEIADLVFAVDSVPAVFAITSDPNIVYTSNIFAILGLRAVYFALAAVLHRFHYLKYALAILLVFIGSKVVVAEALGWVGKNSRQAGRLVSPLRSLRWVSSIRFGNQRIRLCQSLQASKKNARAMNPGVILKWYQVWRR